MSAPTPPTWGQPPPLPPPRSSPPSSPFRRHGDARITTPPTSSTASTTKTNSTINLAPSPVLAAPTPGHSFNTVLHLNLDAFKSQQASSNVKNLLNLRPDHNENQWQARWSLFLNLPENFDGPFSQPDNGDFGVDREVDLGRILVQDSPRLHDLSLHRTIADLVSESSSSASSSRRSASQLAADHERRGIRRPDIAWWATAADPTASPPTRYVTVTGVGEIKCDIDKAKAGFMRGIMYAAQAHSLSGAQLGFSAFREKFARFYALGENVVAVDAPNWAPAESTDAATSMSPAVGSEALVAILGSVSNSDFVQALPLSLRSDDDDVDEEGLAAIARWSSAAYHQLLRLPARGPFRRVPPSRSAAATALLARARVPLDTFEQRLAAVQVVRPKVHAYGGSEDMSKKRTGTSDLSVTSPAPSKRRLPRSQPRSSKKRASALATARGGSGHADAHEGRQAARDHAEDHHQLGTAAESSVSDDDADDEADHEDDEEAVTFGTGEQTSAMEYEKLGASESATALPLIATDEAVPMPKAKHRRDESTFNPSGEESMSEDTLMGIFGHSGVQIIFLSRHEMDALVEEEQTVSTKPGSDNLGRLDLGDPLHMSRTGESR